MTDREDRFRNLPESEQRIASLRRDGHLPVDHRGRPRVPLGDGFESRLARATHPIQEARSLRTTTALTASDLRRMYEAVATANLQGLVLNTFVTVAWRAMGVGSDRYADGLHHRLLDRMRAWFRDRANAGAECPATAVGIWVKENGRTLGLHSHLLMHVPPELHHPFRIWIKSAAAKLGELPDRLPGIQSGRTRPVHVSPNFGESCADQWAVFRYMMKGLDPEEALGLQADRFHNAHLIAEFAGIRPTAQGRIEGKRAGFTQSIGPGARAQVTSELGRFDIWPDSRADEVDLPFDTRYLSAAEFRRQLAAIVI